mmetsp:Transcript_29417/g.59242  ORF Transcript_29417/g.59242 Transcript_29417/m.59242 type:complete len:200 (+) Transcript_29417:38-637(+)
MGTITSGKAGRVQRPWRRWEPTVGLPLAARHRSPGVPRRGRARGHREHRHARRSRARRRRSIRAREGRRDDAVRVRSGRGAWRGDGVRRRSAGGEGGVGTGSAAPSVQHAAGSDAHRSESARERPRRRGGGGRGGQRGGAEDGGERPWRASALGAHDARGADEAERRGQGALHPGGGRSAAESAPRLRRGADDADGAAA